MVTLPVEVMKWIMNLPEPQRTKELRIAERNWARIANHMNKK